LDGEVRTVPAAEYSILTILAPFLMLLANLPICRSLEHFAQEFTDE